ncbi:hypothetical protein PVK06_027034 [Gossypium arboreum]|uniref:Uncharacterized protein n=1 Tax=Gossypium arboreum TaxID=29729 RepID=A0ABR0P0J2_GOSAR|nr:hypothetical protein PVK06_027034 [Gossypium arboreum]
MCLIDSIVKGRKIDVSAILHQKITVCVARQNGIFVFPSLETLLCQQKGIVPRNDEKLSLTPQLEFLGFPPIIQKYEHSSKEDDLGGQDKSVESHPIVHIFDVEKEEDSRDVEECMGRIDSLVEGDLIDGKKAPDVGEEVTVEEEDDYVEVVNEKAKEDNTATEATEKKHVEDIVNTSKFVDVTNDNLEWDGARPAKL